MPFYSIEHFPFGRNHLDKDYLYVFPVPMSIVDQIGAGRFWMGQLNYGQAPRFSRVLDTIKGAARFVRNVELQRLRNRVVPMTDRVYISPAVVDRYDNYKKLLKDTVLLGVMGTQQAGVVKHIVYSGSIESLRNEIADAIEQLQRPTGSTRDTTRLGQMDFLRLSLVSRQLVDVDIELDANRIIYSQYGYGNPIRMSLESRAQHCQHNFGEDDGSGNRRSYCHGLGEYLPIDDFLNNRGVDCMSVSDSYFDDHYSECCSCGGSFHNDSTTYSEYYDATYCDDCYGNTHVTCSHCDYVTGASSDSMVTDDDGEIFCQECRDDGHGEWGDDDDDDDSHAEPEDSRTIRDPRFRPYSTRVDPTPVRCAFPDRETGRVIRLDNECTFGMELELNFKAKDAKEIFDIAEKPEHFGNHAIWKSDGSLTSGGAELVTRPYTLSSFRERNLKSFLKEVKEAGATGFESGECGFHIHLGRRKVAELIAKKLRDTAGLNGMSRSSTLVRDFTNLIYTHNFQSYGGLFIDFSKRLSSRQGLNYCQTRTANDPYEYAWHRDDRRRGLNIQNEATIEVRIWRSTTDFDRLRASIGLSVAFYEYVYSKLSYGLVTASRTGSYSLFDFLKDEPQFKFVWEYLCDQYKVEQMTDWEKDAKRFCIGKLRSCSDIGDISYILKPKIRKMHIAMTKADRLAAIEREARLNSVPLEAGLQEAAQLETTMQNQFMYAENISQDSFAQQLEAQRATLDFRVRQMEEQAAARAEYERNLTERAARERESNETRTLGIEAGNILHTASAEYRVVSVDGADGEYRVVPADGAETRVPPSNGITTWRSPAGQVTITPAPTGSLPLGRCGCAWCNPNGVGLESRQEEPQGLEQTLRSGEWEPVQETASDEVDNLRHSAGDDESTQF